jgi:predicted nuclease of predicted toxin-antitoxin system
VRVSYLLDEQISPRVAELLVKSEVNARAVADSELAGLDDSSVFRKAVEEGRILVTYNIDDMAIVLGDLLKEGAPVPGVIFVDARTIPPSDVPGLARALSRLAGRIEEGAIEPSAGIFLQR